LKIDDILPHLTAQLFASMVVCMST